MTSSYFSIRNTQLQSLYTQVQISAPPLTSYITWTNCLISQCLSFLTHEIQLLMLPASCEGESFKTRIYL